MANISNGNTFYVDTAFSLESDDLARTNTLVTYVIVTATAANGKIVLGDAVTNSTIKMDLRVPTSGSSVMFRFDVSPVIFPKGIRVVQLANAVATIVFKNAGG